MMYTISPVVKTYVSKFSYDLPAPRAFFHDGQFLILRLKTQIQHVLSTYAQLFHSLMLCFVYRMDDSVVVQKTPEDVFARLTSSLAQESDPDM